MALDPLNKSEGDGYSFNALDNPFPGLAGRDPRTGFKSPRVIEMSQRRRLALHMDWAFIHGQGGFLHCFPQLRVSMASARDVFG